MKRFTPVGRMTIHETAYGELCMYAEAKKEIDRLIAMVEWRPIATAPVNQQIMLADMSGGNRDMYIGIIYPSTGHGRATHWLPMLPLPNAPDQPAGALPDGQAD